MFEISSLKQAVFTSFVRLLIGFISVNVLCNLSWA